jgi:hypothetical protein
VHNKGWQITTINAHDQSLSKEIKLRGFHIHKLEQIVFKFDHKGPCSIANVTLWYWYGTYTLDTKRFQFCLCNKKNYYCVEILRPFVEWLGWVWSWIQMTLSLLLFNPWWQWRVRKTIVEWTLVENSISFIWFRGWAMFEVEGWRHLLMFHLYFEIKL